MKIRITKENPAALLFKGTTFRVEQVSENGLGKTVYLIRHAGETIGVPGDRCEVLEDETAG